VPETQIVTMLVAHPASQHARHPCVTTFPNHGVFTTPHLTALYLRSLHAMRGNETRERLSACRLNDDLIL
jgi:hypothetical protein